MFTCTVWTVEFKLFKSLILLKPTLIPEQTPTLSTLPLLEILQSVGFLGRVIVNLELTLLKLNAPIEVFLLWYACALIGYETIYAVWKEDNFLSVFLADKGCIWLNWSCGPIIEFFLSWDLIVMLLKLPSLRLLVKMLTDLRFLRVFPNFCLIAILSVTYCFNDD